MASKKAVQRNDELHLDGWTNFLSGMGQTGRDRKESTSFAPEYRLPETTCRNLYTYSGLAKAIVDLPVYDGIRKWLTVEGDEDNLIQNECKRLAAKREFFRSWKWSRAYGGAIMVMMVNDGRMLDEPLDESNIQNIEALKVYHRWRTSRISYYLDTNDPRYSETELYMIAPVQPLNISYKVHESRCIIFDGVDVAPEIRVGNQWWGDSIYQAIYQRLRGLGESYSNIEHIIGEFMLMITKIKGLSQKLAENREQELIQRAIVNNMTRHVMNSYMIDADGEDASRISATTTGLGELIEKMMMAVSAETRIPIRRLFGTPIAAAGLGKEGDEETRDYYDFVTSERLDVVESQFERFIKLVMLQKKGPFSGKEIPNWKIVWPALMEESETEKLNNRKTMTEIDRQNWEMGVYGEDEIRAKGYDNSHSFDRVMQPRKTTAPSTTANFGLLGRGDSADGVNVNDTNLKSLVSLRLPKVLDGYLYCSGNQLKNHVGAPEIVRGEFVSNHNPLESLEGSPRECMDFHCNSNGLKSLVGGPKKCMDYHVHNNELTSFEGAPQDLKKDLHAYFNKLTSLKGLPDHIGGDLFVSDNQLTTLEGIPKYIGGDLDLRNNPGHFTEADVRACSLVKGHIRLDGLHSDSKKKVNFDGGEGSGIKGHTTARGKEGREGKTVDPVEKETHESLAVLHDFSKSYSETHGSVSERNVNPKKVKNTAKTADDLHADAKEAEPILRSIVGDAAKAANGEPYFGPGDKFAVKSKESLHEKIDIRKKHADQIGDSVRGTVVVPEMKDVKGATETLKGSIEKSGGRVLAIDDKYANPIKESGYVGIHVDALLKTPGGNFIKAEIQIHDGDMHIKEPSEKIYQQHRAKKEIPPEIQNQMRALYTPFMKSQIK